MNEIFMISLHHPLLVTLRGHHAVIRPQESPEMLCSIQGVVDFIVIIADIWNEI